MKPGDVFGIARGVTWIDHQTQDASFCITETKRDRFVGVFFEGPDRARICWVSKTSFRTLVTRGLVRLRRDSQLRSIARRIATAWPNLVPGWTVEAQR